MRFHNQSNTELVPDCSSSESIGLQPIRIEPYFDHRPWGAKSLAPLFPERTNLSEPIGEAWLTGDSCQIATGPFVGRRLADAWRVMGTQWAGTALSGHEIFPLLLKFLFTENKPSVQVHPGDEYAARNEHGARGKTEMWYVVAARPAAEVMVGLKKGVTRESFRRSISHGTAEQNLQRVSVEVGDAIFVPAGTAHTIGGGLVLCEVQQNSDITYRVYDYQRRDANGKTRPLHIEKALEVMEFGDQVGGKVEPISMESNGITKTYFKACRYFATELWSFQTRVEATTSAKYFDLFVVTEGRGIFEWPSGMASYEQGQVWLMPAALGTYKIVSTNVTSLLRAYIPVNFQEVSANLTGQQVHSSVLSRLIYAPTL
jgi:mannose-6-phosphate isomerase